MPRTTRLRIAPSMYRQPFSSSKTFPQQVLHDHYPVSSFILSSSRIYPLTHQQPPSTSPSRPRTLIIHPLPPAPYPTLFQRMRIPRRNSLLLLIPPPPIKQERDHNNDNNNDNDRDCHAGFLASRELGFLPGPIAAAAALAFLWVARENVAGKDVAREEDGEVVDIHF